MKPEMVEAVRNSLRKQGYTFTAEERQRPSLPEAEIIYIAEARVKFTAEEVNALFAASESHYDGLCRRQSQPGGILWGLRNRIEYPPIEQCMSTYDVDLLAKIAEQLDLVYRHLDSSNPIFGIPFKLSKIFKVLNDEYKRLNP
jgi:hypothetical protein